MNVTTKNLEREFTDVFHSFFSQNIINFIKNLFSLKKHCFPQDFKFMKLLLGSISQASKRSRYSLVGKRLRDKVAHTSYSVLVMRSCN